MDEESILELRIDLQEQKLDQITSQVRDLSQSIYSLKETLDRFVKPMGMTMVHDVKQQEREMNLNIMANRCRGGDGHVEEWNNWQSRLLDLDRRIQLLHNQNQEHGSTNLMGVGEKPSSKVCWKNRDLLVEPKPQIKPKNLNQMTKVMGPECSIKLKNLNRSINVSEQSSLLNDLSHRLIETSKLPLMHRLLTPKNYFINYFYEVSGFWSAFLNWSGKTEHTEFCGVRVCYKGLKPGISPNNMDFFATSYVSGGHNSPRPPKPPDYNHNSVIMQPPHLVDHPFVLITVIRNYLNQKEKLISTWQLRTNAEVHPVWSRTEIEHHMFMFDGISLFLWQNYVGVYKSLIQSIVNGVKRDSHMNYAAMVLAIRTEGKRVVYELIKFPGVPLLIVLFFKSVPIILFANHVFMFGRISLVVEQHLEGVYQSLIKSMLQCNPELENSSLRKILNDKITTIFELVPGGRDLVMCIDCLDASFDAYEGTDRSGDKKIQEQLTVAAETNCKKVKRYGGIYNNSDVIAAAILNTRTNATYAESVDVILEWQGLLSKPGEMVINIAWGNIWLSHIPLIEYDESLVSDSLNPKKLLFEKLVSGICLGAVMRRVLSKMAEEAEVFGDILPTKHQLGFILSTPDVSAMLRDSTPNPKVVATKVKNTLEISSTYLKMIRLTVELCGIFLRADLFNLAAAQLNRMAATTNINIGMTNKLVGCPLRCRELEYLRRQLILNFLINQNACLVLLKLGFQVLVWETIRSHVGDEEDSTCYPVSREHLSTHYISKDIKKRKLWMIPWQLGTNKMGTTKDGSRKGFYFVPSRLTNFRLEDKPGLYGGGIDREYNMDHLYYTTGPLGPSLFNKEVIYIYLIGGDWWVSRV